MSNKDASSDGAKSAAGGIDIKIDSASMATGDNVTSASVVETSTQLSDPTTAVASTAAITKASPHQSGDVQALVWDGAATLEGHADVGFVQPHVVQDVALPIWIQGDVKPHATPLKKAQGDTQPTIMDDAKAHVVQDVKFALVKESIKSAPIEESIKSADETVKSAPIEESIKSADETAKSALVKESIKSDLVEDSVKETVKSDLVEDSVKAANEDVKSTLVKETVELALVKDSVKADNPTAESAFVEENVQPTLVKGSVKADNPGGDAQSHVAQHVDMEGPAEPQPLDNAVNIIGGSRLVAQMGQMMGRAGLSLESLGAAMGRDSNYTSSIFDGLITPTLADLVVISSMMGIHIDVLMFVFRVGTWQA